MAQKVYKVLFIEDDLAAAGLVQAILEENENIKYDIRYTNKLDKGLACLKEESSCVILLDLGLKECEGVETIKRIKTKYPDVPIIVLTAFDDEDVKEDVMKEGVKAYFIKGKVSGNGLRHAIIDAAEGK